MSRHDPYRRCRHLDLTRVGQAAFLLAVMACRGPGHPHHRERVPASHLAIYQRSHLQFDAAVYYKPAGGAGGLDPYLAPLMIREASPGATDACPHAFGRLQRSDAGKLSVNADRPTVYFERKPVSVHGRPGALQRLIWFYDTPDDCGDCLPLQGLRILENESGHPLIWEVLSGHTSTRVFFVSKRLEHAAREQFKRPLPGRRFATEPDLSVAPDVVVARILQDSAVPLGPIAYIPAGSREIATVICRCMPSQAGAFSETVTYELRPLADLDPLGVHLVDWMSSSATRDWSVHEGLTWDEPLDALPLRLPSVF